MIITINEWIIDMIKTVKVLIKADEEIIFNDFLEPEKVAEKFVEITNIQLNQLTSMGMELSLLKNTEVQYEVALNGIKYKMTADPKIGDQLEYVCYPHHQQPNCYFKLSIYGENCRGTTTDTRTIIVEGDEAKAIDLIKKLNAFFDDHDSSYNEELSFSKDDDYTADASCSLSYSFYPYIEYHAYGKIFQADIKSLLKGN